jgi:hypothetical protein
MQTTNVKARFHIYTGYREAGAIVNAQQAGEAYEIETSERSYYLIKMWALPRETYYLAPNQDGFKFTLFAKYVGEESAPRFRRPVGFGLVSSELTKHLEIQFTFPRQRVFMSLFPDKVTFDSLLGPSGGVPA